MERHLPAFWHYSGTGIPFYLPRLVLYLVWLFLFRQTKHAMPLYAAYICVACVTLRMHGHGRAWHGVVALFIQILYLLVHSPSFGRALFKTACARAAKRQKGQTAAFNFNICHHRALCGPRGRFYNRLRFTSSGVLRRLILTFFTGQATTTSTATHAFALLVGWFSPSQPALLRCVIERLYLNATHCRQHRADLHASCCAHFLRLPT